MINHTQVLILGSLLDKYERSSFFRDRKPPSRRIMLNFYNGGKSDVPYYNIEDSEERLTVNRDVQELAELGLLGFDWMKGEHGHIIAKVWLNFDNLDMAYQAVKRKPKADIIQDLCVEVQSVLVQLTSGWAQSFLQEAQNILSLRRDFISMIPQSEEERTFLYKAILAINKLNGSEISERVFSLKSFGDTKKFEQTVKPRIINILRKYQDLEEDLTDEDVLRQIGIYKYPEYFEFCGKLCFTVNDETVNFVALRFGTSLSIADLKRGNVTIQSDVKRILSIENKANYVEYIRNSKKEDELIIYHGGYFSPAKKLFFLAIFKGMPKGCTWSHWGDIDYGGFRILARLRTEINPEILAFQMGKHDLVKHRHLTSTTSSNYVEKLKRLIQNPVLHDCVECINYMVTHKIRLEQEAMLTESKSFP